MDEIHYDLLQRTTIGRDICNDYFIGVLAVIFTNTVPHARAPSGAAATNL